MDTRLFALFDDKEKKYVCRKKREITFAAAKKVNSLGYGIFFTPNPCIGRLLEENVVSINWWFIDIDDGTKEEMLKRIKTSPVPASVIVETKRGYHAYWRAKNGTKEKFRTIEQGLINYFGGDNAVKNPNRLMRMPNYYHMKDPDNPFLIKIIEQNDNAYTETLMELAFVPIKAVKKVKFKNTEEVKIEGFRSEETLIKYFCSKLNGDLSCFVADSGRRTYLLQMIGRLKRHYNYSFEERSKIIHIINRHFACPLDDDEVETVLNTTIKDKNV